MAESVCGHHEHMLEKSEFRWVFGICFIVLIGILSIMYSNSASIDQLRSIDEKVKYRDANADKQSQRVEKALDKLNTKMDAIDAYLRGGTTGARYQ